jgi:hypothetical protein
MLKEHKKFDAEAFKANLGAKDKIVADYKTKEKGKALTQGERIERIEKLLKI